MMRLYRRYVSVGVTIFVILVFWFYFVSLWTTSTISSKISSVKKNQSTINLTALMSQPIVHVWCCVTNVKYSGERQVLKNFKILLKSLLQTSTHRLSINVIGDIQNKNTILSTIFKAEDEVGSVFYEILFYDSAVELPKIKYITQNMMPHFSAWNDYFNLPEFYLQVGLPEIAPESQHKVIFLDTDLKFRDSIAGLYDYFSKFSPETLFAIGRELSPGYFKHLRKWAVDVLVNSTYIDPTAKRYAGVNMGVMLLDLKRIRESGEFWNCIGTKYLDYITKKYEYRGSWGGQDFLTLLELEKPHLFHILPCTWNRQLCLYWTDPKLGVADLFDFFFHCNGRIHVYHGNGGTSIPDD